MKKFTSTHFFILLLCCLVSLSLKSQLIYRNGQNCLRAIDLESPERCQESVYSGKGQFWFYFVVDSSDVNITIKQSYISSNYSPITDVIFLKGSCNSQIILSSNTYLSNDSLLASFLLDSLTIGDSCFVNILTASATDLLASICLKQGKESLDEYQSSICNLICNGSFDFGLNPTNSNGCFYNAWGTPQVLNDGSGNNVAYMWASPCSVNPQGEAVMVTFSNGLDVNSHYLLDYKIKVVGGNSPAALEYFGVELTTNAASSLPITSSSNCNGQAGPIPNFSSSQNIDNVTNLAINSAWINRQVCFQPNLSNKNSIVFYPKQAISLNTTGNVYLDDVSLIKVEDKVYNSEICLGSQVQLNNECEPHIGATYLWTPSVGLTCSNCAQPNASPNVSTTYTCLVNIVGGCSYSVIQTVNVVPPPTQFTVSMPSQLCGNVNFTPTIVPVTNGYVYTWVFSNGSTYTGSNPIINLPSGSISYTVTAVSEFCQSILQFSDVINVIAFAPPVLSNNLIKGCPNDIVNLSITNPVSGLVYTWSPTTGIAPTNGTSVTATITPNANGTTYSYAYTVLASNGGCSASAIQVITCYETPQIQLMNDVTICEGASITLTGFGGPFNWSTGQNANSILVTPSSTTTYSATITDFRGCVASDVVTVNVIPRPNGNLIVSTNPICPNSQTCFSAAYPNISGAIYTFNDGNGNVSVSSTGNNVCFNYPSAGTYYPRLTVSLNGCNSPEQSTTLEVLYPKVDININTLECGVVTFSASPNSCIPPDAIYSWNVNGATQASIGNPITIGGQSATSGFVSLTVTSLTGTILYVSNNQFYSIPIQQQLCCGINTECVEEIVLPGRTTEIICAQETWSGTKEFFGTNTINDVAITVMPNTIIKINAGATVNFGKCTFLMYDNSKILVNKNATQLKFNKCYLHGCNKLWEGISMEQSGGSLPINPPIVIFTNSVIEDALVALDFSKNNDYVNLDVRYASFNKNITGVKLVNKPTSGTNGVYSLIRIRDASFTCKNFSLSMNPDFSDFAGSDMYYTFLAAQPDAMPLPKVGLPAIPVHAKSMTGIILKGYLASGNTYYGKTDQISPLETLIFDNLVQGISIIGLSMPELKGHKFKNIKSPINGGLYNNYYGNVPAGVLLSGVSLYGSSGLVYTINRVGSITPTINTRNKFSDCYYGVYSRDEAVNVTYNDFTDCYNGIYIGNANVPSTSNGIVNTTVKGNQFLRLKYTGVMLDKNLSINSEITSNNINNNTGLNFTSRAVDIVEANKPTSAKYLVLDNNFARTWQGVRTTLTYAPIITNNKIILNTNNSNPTSVATAPYNTGIHIVDCEAPQVNENEISNPSNLNTWWEQGIVSVFSRNGRFYCNDVNGTFSGLTTGDNCLGTLIFKNDIHNAKFGHWLIFGNVMGYNYNPLSSSFAPPGVAPSYAQPTDNRYYNVTPYHSWSQNATNGLLNTQFYTRSATSSPFAMINNGYEILPLPQISSTSLNTLTPSSPLLPYTPLGCVGNDGIPNGRLMSLAKQVAIDGLYPITDVKNRFVSRMQLLSNLSKDNIGNTGDYDIDNFPALISNEPVAKLFNVDMLAQQGVDYNDSTYIVQAQGLNVSFVPNDSIEKLQQQVNEIYLTYLKKGGVLDEIGKSTLKGIAPLCPYRYGTSIWEARAILVGYDDTQYFNLCEYYSAPDNALDNSRLAQVIDENLDSESSTLTIYPNPNNGNFKIELPLGYNQVSLEVVNLVGEVIKQTNYDILEGNNIIEVEDLKQGLYFVIVKSGGLTIGSNKVLVAK